MVARMTRACIQPPDLSSTPPAPTHARTLARAGRGVCLVDCNDPAQMVKEVGAVAFPTAVHGNIPKEAQQDVGKGVFVCL